MKNNAIVPTTENLGKIQPILREFSLVLSRLIFSGSIRAPPFECTFVLNVHSWSCQSSTVCIRYFSSLGNNNQVGVHPTQVQFPIVHWEVYQKDNLQDLACVKIYFLDSCEDPGPAEEDYPSLIKLEEKWMITLGSLAALESLSMMYQKGWCRSKCPDIWWLKNWDGFYHFPVVKHLWC